MTDITMHYYPDGCLRDVNLTCDDAFFSSFKTADLGKMIDLCRAHHGYALAAPQVGINRKFFIIPPHASLPSSTPLFITNPRIDETDGSMRYRESCLSIPGFFSTLVRPERFVLHYTDGISGKEKTYNCSRLLARVVQHECDHINGVLFTDHLKGLAKEDADKFLKKMLINNIKA